ncbi:MAG: tetratricopeptide (TPR) repeat protein [Myxococcota bacterium]|jgi:tetratricopeptide (TPR) repeat protein
MLEAIHRALQLVEFLPQKVVQGLLQSNLAIALTRQRRFAEAREHFSRSLHLLQQNGQLQRYAAVLHYRATLFLRQGLWAEARRDYLEELSSMRRSSEERSQAHALEGLAQLSIEEGDLAAAAAFAEEGLGLAEGCGDIVLLADLHLALGLAHYLSGALPAAAVSLEQARGVAGDWLPPDHQGLLSCLSRALAHSRGEPFSAIDDASDFGRILAALESGALAALQSCIDPTQTPDILLRLAARAVRRTLLTAPPAATRPLQHSAT